MLMAKYRNNSRKEILGESSDLSSGSYRSLSISKATLRLRVRPSSISQSHWQILSHTAVSKTLTLFVNVVDGTSPYFSPLADTYMNLFLQNANTGYAEVTVVQ